MDAGGDIRDLIAAARRGAPDAIGRLFEAARSDLLQVAARELPAEVRAKVAPSDVVQETAIDMQRDFARFSGNTADELFAWLRGILRYNIIDVARRDRAAIRRESARDTRQPTRERVGNIPTMTRSPAGSAIRREEAAALASAMARLAPADREVLEMRHWQGMTFVAMAPLVGRSEEAVRKMWYRAVARLRVELAAAANGGEVTRDITATGVPSAD